MKSLEKRIDVINRYAYPVTAGIETVITEVFSRMVKRGYHVTIHASQNTLTEWNVLPPSDSVNGIKIKRSHYTKFGFFPKVNWDKAQTVFLMNFDMFPHMFVLSYCGLLKLLGKKKFTLVLAPHGGYTPGWETFSPLARIVKRTYHKTLGRILINNVVDIIHAVSDWEKREMISYGIDGNNIQVIGNGLEDVAFENSELKSSEKIKKQVKNYSNYIVQLGRIDPIKNQALTIRAMKYLPEEIKFIIVGPVMSSLYMKKLQSLIKRLKLQERVIFAGTIKGYDKYYLLRHAKLMIHMALWENHPISILEGTSQGLYAIVGDHTGLRDAVIPEKTGSRLLLSNAKNLAKKIDSVYGRTPKIYTRTLQRSHYLESWDGVVDQLIKIIHEKSYYVSVSKTPRFGILNFNSEPAQP